MGSVSDVPHDPPPSDAYVLVGSLAVGDRLKIRLSKPDDQAWLIINIQEKPLGFRQLGLARGGVRKLMLATEIVTINIASTSMLERLPPQPEPRPIRIKEWTGS